MKTVLSAILALAVLAAPAPLATGDDQAPAEGAQETTEGDEGPLEEFIPSEEVPADSAISFPVDI